MKKIVAMMIAMMVSSSAFANTPEFVDGLVDVINQQLAVVNQQRAQDGEKLYCTELDGKQATLIASYFRSKKANAWLTLDSVNASRFIQMAGANLSCFPKPCKNYDDLVHGICNMKSYKMDRDLLRSALEQLKGGKVYVNDTMADVAR